MNILKISEEKDMIRQPDSFITPDRKYLCLIYPHIYNSTDSDSDHYESYDDFFDKLDSEEHTYEIIEKLKIDTDFIWELPTNVSKFVNLKEIMVSGSRFFDLTMQNIPSSIKIIRFVDHSNLSCKCTIGMERLINLEEVHLKFEPFGHYFNIHQSHYFYHHEESPKITPIPNLLNLKMIVFYRCEQGDFKPNWNEIIIRNEFFCNIRERITRVEFKGGIRITLN